MELAYKNYTKADIEASHKMQEGATIYHYLNDKNRSCYLLLTVRTFATGYTHVEFYAESIGWEELTDTGYRSFFIETERLQGIGDNGPRVLKLLFEDRGLVYDPGQPIQQALF